MGKISSLLGQAEPESLFFLEKYFFIYFFLVTPLQQKLETIARDIGKFGLYSATFILIVLIIRFIIVRTTADPVDRWRNETHWNELLGFFITAVEFLFILLI